MTGLFAKSGRSGPCVLSECRTVIQAGELVYLWHGLERQTVCLSCAKGRWGYVPTETVERTAPAHQAKTSIGFDSAKTILQSLQRKANALDPKLRQAGGDE